MQADTLLLWSVVNLIDGEAEWFIRLLAYLTVATVITYILKKGSDILLHHFHQSNKQMTMAVLRAISRPFGFYFWFLVVAESIDLVADRFLSLEFHTEVKLVLGIGAIFALSWFFLRLKKNVLEVVIERKRHLEGHYDIGRVYAFSKLISIFIVMVTGILLMEITDQNIKTIIAFGGISGLAFAFASQEIIANFFWGIMLYINQPFGVGDDILLPDSNIEGTVEYIGWYQTRIRSQDKRPIYIPNTLISKVFVINSSRMTHRRLNIQLSIRHEDLSKAPAIIEGIEEYLLAHPAIDSSQDSLVNISAVSLYSTDISIKALSNYTGEREFLRLRDEVIVKAVSLIHEHKAQLALPVQETIEARG